MARTLIIQHVLPQFATRKDGTTVFDPDEYIPAIQEWIERCSPEKVIMTVQAWGDKVYPELGDAATQAAIWKWEDAFCRTTDAVAREWDLPEEDVVCTESGGEMYYSRIYPWLKELANDNIIVMGGFRDECLRGLCDALDQLEVDYDLHRDRLYPRG